MEQLESKEKILENVDKLVNMYKKGLLGGEVMPEDSNPHLERNSLENYNYYTLPMALIIKEIRINYGKVLIRHGKIKLLILFLILKK